MPQAIATCYVVDVGGGIAYLQNFHSGEVGFSLLHLPLVFQDRLYSVLAHAIVKSQFIAVFTKAYGVLGGIVANGLFLQRGHWVNNIIHPYQSMGFSGVVLVILCRYIGLLLNVAVFEVIVIAWQTTIGLISIVKDTITHF